MTGRRDRAGLSRREYLTAGVAAGGLGLAGCGALLNRVDPDSTDQLSVTITAVPDDDDRQVNGIFTDLEAKLNAVGIDVSFDLRMTHEFYRAILMENDFDMYVGYFPGDRTLDYLYMLCHSQFINDPGWQNPFGLTNIQLDDHLEAQRREAGERRAETLVAVLETLVETKPFVPICEPSQHRVVTDQHFGGWRPDRLNSSLGYLGLEQVGSTADMTGLLLDARATQNVNPLAVFFRRRGAVVNLLYDSIARYVDGSLTPWLATDWTMDETSATVTLREDCHFHDDEALTADDVVFTYDLIADLSLGRAESPVPSPRFRRERSLIEAVEVIDDETVAFRFDRTTDPVGDGLTIPILPRHIWEPLVEELDEETATTEPWLRDALLSARDERVGSGPYAVEELVEREELSLVRNDEHFTLRESVDLPAPTAETLRFLPAANSSSAIAMVETGEASVTVSPLESHAIPDPADLDGARLVETNSSGFYHVGFNLRHEPFSNTNLRRAIASLIDREWLVADVFEGNARPITAPRSDAFEDELAGRSAPDRTVPFAGDSGELDVEAARDRFREAGFKYDEDGRLVVND
ncbi:ABC transporter substrate-binding protein [Halovivax limisalsi]|uniref:ABC transporter substrate-binding protein n=1 Tax=Halovivax limisalsi TaxID=1453760 RepID=UPI001FFC9582|nr:ABC transporter substrate-binding protein [Halovivax limisalsi]